MTPAEIILDVRDMEPPEPYVAATTALTTLQPGQYLRMISARRPRMLYPWLQQRGFREDTRELDDEQYEIYIWRMEDHETGEAIAGMHP